VQLRIVRADDGRDLVEMAGGFQRARIEVDRYAGLAKPVEHGRYLHAAAEMVGVAGVEIHRQRVPGRHSVVGGGDSCLRAQTFDFGLRFAQLATRGEVAVEHRAHEGHGRIDGIVRTTGSAGQNKADLVIGGFGQVPASVASVEGHGNR
jgi:hypothetical protein